MKEEFLPFHLWCVRKCFFLSVKPLSVLFQFLIRLVKNTIFVSKDPLENITVILQKIKMKTRSKKRQLNPA